MSSSRKSPIQNSIGSLKRRMLVQLSIAGDTPDKKLIEDMFEMIRTLHTSLDDRESEIEFLRGAVKDAEIAIDEGNVSWEEEREKRLKAEKKVSDADQHTSLKNYWSSGSYVSIVGYNGRIVRGSVV